MRVVVTREAGYNDSLRAWLSIDDVVDEVPLTTTAFVDDASIEASVAALVERNIRYLVVTSARAARGAQIASRLLSVPVLSVGAATSAALESRGVVVSGEGESAVDVARRIEAGPVLSLGARDTRPELAGELATRGIESVHVACYETNVVALTDEQCETLRRADAVLIGAPSAWEVARADVRAETWVVVPGATTRDTVLASHERVLEGWGPDLATRLADLAVEREQ